jgi:hypothetical protein
MPAESIGAFILCGGVWGFWCVISGKLRTAGVRYMSGYRASDAYGAGVYDMCRSRGMSTRCVWGFRGQTSSSGDHQFIYEYLCLCF